MTNSIMNFTFHHINLIVKDINQSKNFYLTLGFKLTKQYSDDSIIIYHLTNSNNYIIELFQYKTQKIPQSLSQESNLDSKLDNNNQLKQHLVKPGLNHFALYCNNLIEVYTKLKNLGVGWQSEITQGRMGIKYFFIKDPDGNFIEIVTN